MDDDLEERRTRKLAEIAEKDKQRKERKKQRESMLLSMPASGGGDAYID